MITKHIALICDDNYCFPTIVCIQSIINHASSNYEYVIHVCTFGLTKENKESLQRMGKNNVEVVINQFDMSDYREKLKKISQKTHVSPTALIKFELPVFFSELDTLLYLDSDIILKGSIDELFDVNLHDNYLAAAYEFHQRLNKINYSFKRDYQDFYFNSGVMLLNLNKMRQDDVTPKLWYFKENCTKTQLMDQETLNSVCMPKVVPLSIIWNFNPFFYKERYLKEINGVYHEDFNDLNALENKVCIIHYVGKSDKPWLYEDAKLRVFWDDSLKAYNPGAKLDLKKYPRDRQNKINSIRAKIRMFGTKGIMCYAVNRLLNRTLL